MKQLLNFNIIVNNSPFSFTLDSIRARRSQSEEEEKETTREKSELNRINK